jgi:hypothetical protein
MEVVEEIINKTQTNSEQYKFIWNQETGHQIPKSKQRNNPSRALPSH